MNENCIFCKIANGTIPSTVLYEDDNFRVILDVAPATKGHALILPKEHYRNIFDLEEDVAAKLFALATRVARAMKETLACDGLNIIQNNEAVAGQTVFHFHMHLIPRYEGDGQRILWTSKTSKREELEEVAANIRNILN